MIIFCKRSSRRILKSIKAEIVIEVKYKLRQGIKLRQKEGKNFVISQTPLKILKVNHTLMNILHSIGLPTTIERLMKEYPGIGEEKLRQVLYDLAEKGYLERSEVLGGGYPLVSVIIPVKNRSEDIRNCLRSLQSLDYPVDRCEVIVIDDGSTDDTTKVIDSFQVKSVYLRQTQGASACRNRGVKEARGELIAFIDSDCQIDPNWLKELVSYFQNEQVGIVGGYVASSHTESILGRYESVSSPLNMGPRSFMGMNDSSTLYVPTCNLIVRKKAFIDVGGFAEELKVGEDVDLCWRLRKHDWLLLYVPQGKVMHSDRSSPLRMLKRRYDYGTSEAILSLRHRDKKKNLSFVLPYAVFYGLVSLYIIVSSWLPLAIGLGILGIDIVRKIMRLSRMGLLGLNWIKIAGKVGRAYFSCSYYLSFHLIRYYLILFVCLGFLLHGLWMWIGGALLLTAGLDYYLKKPKIGFASFFTLYTLEHLSYQIGVFIGCLKLKYFRSYLPIFRRILPDRIPTVKRKGKMYR